MTFLLVHCCLGQTNTSKKVLGRLNKIRHRQTELKRRRIGYQLICIPNFISKEECPPSSPDLNPLDFGVWGYLESKVSATHHKSLEALKTKLRKEWLKMPQDVIRDSCRSFSRRLQLVIDSNEKHIE